MHLEVFFTFAVLSTVVYLSIYWETLLVYSGIISFFVGHLGKLILGSFVNSGCLFFMTASYILIPCITCSFL